MEQEDRLWLDVMSRAQTVAPQQCGASTTDIEQRLREAMHGVTPKGLSPLPWSYHNDPLHGSMGRDWIEDANGFVVVENIGHIDGPWIVQRANAALASLREADHA